MHMRMWLTRSMHMPVPMSTVSVRIDVSVPVPLLYRVLFGVHVFLLHLVVVLYLRHHCLSVYPVSAHDLPVVVVIIHMSHRVLVHVVVVLAVRLLESEVGVDALILSSQ